MVAICRMNGMLAQEAFDRVGDLLQERYRRWDVVEGQVRSWGEEVDKQVQRYVEAIKCVVKANLYWRYGTLIESRSLYLALTDSFESERYLGSSSGDVRRTRKIRVLASPEFLTKS